MLEFYMKKKDFIDCKNNKEYEDICSFENDMSMLFLNKIKEKLIIM